MPNGEIRFTDGTSSAGDHSNRSDSPGKRQRTDNALSPYNNEGYDSLRYEERVSKAGSSGTQHWERGMGSSDYRNLPMTEDASEASARAQEAIRETEEAIRETKSKLKVEVEKSIIDILISEGPVKASRVLDFLRYRMNDDPQKAIIGLKYLETIPRSHQSSYSPSRYDNVKEALFKIKKGISN